MSENYWWVKQIALLLRLYSWCFAHDLSHIFTNARLSQERREKFLH